LSRKILLIIGIVLAVLCICSIVGGLILVNRTGQFISNTTSNDPGKVAEVAQKIADYQLPSGYKEIVSMNLLGVSRAGFASKDEHIAIFMFQMPANTQMSSEQFRQQIQQMIERQTGQSIKLKEVGTRTVSIRSQSVEMSILEGSNSNGEIYRQMMGEFTGKGGPALLMISGSTANWDQASIDQFIKSLR
jgi:hypothetical protein